MKRKYLEYKINKLERKIKQQQKAGNVYKAYELSLIRFELSHKLLNNY